MNKHTTGPWTVDDCGWIESACGESVVEYSGCGSHEALWDKQALNIVLAAPDLLEALSEIINDGGKFVMTSETHRKASAAIASARGEA